MTCHYGLIKKFLKSFNFSKEYLVSLYYKFIYYVFSSGEKSNVRGNIDESRILLAKSISYQLLLKLIVQNKVKVISSLIIGVII